MVAELGIEALGEHRAMVDGFECSLATKGVVKDLFGGCIP